MGLPYETFGDRSRLWKPTGIFDPETLIRQQRMMTEEQRVAAEKARHAKREQEEFKKKQAAIAKARAKWLEKDKLAPWKPLPGTVRERLVDLCAIEGVEFADIVGLSRRAHICRIREGFLKTLVDEFPKFTLTLFGALFDRDHTTIHAMMVRSGIKPPTVGAARQPRKPVPGAGPDDDVTGIYYTKPGRYRAEFYLGGKNVVCGTFDTVAEAIAARRSTMKRVIEGG